MCGTCITCCTCITFTTCITCNYFIYFTEHLKKKKWNTDPLTTSNQEMLAHLKMLLLVTINTLVFSGGGGGYTHFWPDPLWWGGGPAPRAKIPTFWPAKYSALNSFFLLVSAFWLPYSWSSVATFLLFLLRLSTDLHISLKRSKILFSESFS